MPKVRLGPWQVVALNNPYQHFAFYGGVATGKTYTGSQFAIKMITEHPDLTGFIGANTYDQMSQATLRELFYWLDIYGFDYVVDALPPREWGVKKKFKTYKNILSVRNRHTGKVTYIFTRVLSDGDPLRGVEFSWYWLDETRDTPEYTHDVILSRMRESDIQKGLITTTTNGEDWSYNRFVRGNDGSGLYGSMHVPTIRSVQSGIITQQYFNTMLRSYSELMAAQELDAQHVNVGGGRAYYAANVANKRHAAPWGDRYPTRDRPLIVGCDFNFSPAPCVWVVGQVGPPIHGPNGEFWGECIHWFYEIQAVESSTRSMTLMLLSSFPRFFYRVFGDASGNRGSTSNAGQTDYDQMADELSQAGALHTIDVDQNNPLVKNRVENMNRMFKNAIGEIRQTYDPSGCPLLDADVRVVGWKPTVQRGQGKLDNAGDVQRTHASDGAGYAIWKLFPPGRRANIVDSVPSAIRKELSHV